MYKRYAKIVYITARQRVQSTQNDDLGVMGGCRLLVAGKEEGAGVLNRALFVEGVEDKLLDRLRHCESSGDADSERATGGRAAQKAEAGIRDKR